MIDLERFSVFAGSFEQDLSPELEQIRESAREQGIPIIRREMQSFLRFLLCVSKPRRILEIGTGTGFSSLFMRACLLKQMGQDCDRYICIDTIEISAENARQARDHIDRLGARDMINLIEADAGTVLPQMEGPYDFVFLDGPKGQYEQYLPLLIERMAKGALLVADNVLKNGEILDSRYAVPRRQRTIHARMHTYLYEVTHNPKLVSSIIPLGDGVSLSVRLQEPDLAGDING